MARADLHFHLDGPNLEEIERVAYKIADHFYGYKDELDNPEFVEWQKAKDAWELNEQPPETSAEYDEQNPPPERKIHNTVPRPYKISIEANVDGTPEEYVYVRKFRASVKCYTPYEYND